jgi:hypothetical protein
MALESKTEFKCGPHTDDEPCYLRDGEKAAEISTKIGYAFAVCKTCKNSVFLLEGMRDPKHD